MKRKLNSNSMINTPKTEPISQSISNSMNNGPKRKRRKLQPPSLIAIDSKHNSNHNESHSQSPSSSHSPNIPIFCMVHCMKIHYASNLDNNKYDKCQMCLEENTFDSMHFIYQCSNCSYYVCNFCFGELYQKNKTSFSPQIINHYHKNIKSLKLNGNLNGNNINSRSRSKSRMRKSRKVNDINDNGSSSKSKSKRMKTKNNNKNGSRYRYNSDFKEHGIRDKHRNGNGMKLRSSDDTDYSLNDDNGSIASRTRNSRRKTRRNQQNVSYH